MDLSIVIVSWNVREHLQRCLRSIEPSRSRLRLEVIVVDNASHDGSPGMVRGEFPWVHLVATDDNLGFPRGNNVGLRSARGRYLLLLNPDTEICDAALTTMVSFLEEQPAVGVVGPMLLFPDGRVQSSRRRFPTLATGFFESTWFEPWAPTRIIVRYRVLDRPDGAVSDVDWVSGAALMVRREVVAQIGLLDEDYFMYSEELDWCRRIKDAGWRVVFMPWARIVHHEGKSSEQAVTARHINFQRAKLRYFRKFHGQSTATALRIFLIVNYLLQILIEGVKGVVGHKRALRWQRIESYWRILQSGLGPAGY